MTWYKGETPCLPEGSGASRLQEERLKLCPFRSVNAAERLFHDEAPPCDHVKESNFGSQDRGHERLPAGRIWSDGHECHARALELNTFNTLTCQAEVRAVVSEGSLLCSGLKASGPAQRSATSDPCLHLAFHLRVRLVPLDSLQLPLVRQKTGTPEELAAGQRLRAPPLECAGKLRPQSLEFSAGYSRCPNSVL